MWVKKDSEKEVVVKRKVSKVLNKSMEAFNYPQLGKVVYAKTQKEADEQVKKYL